MGWCGAVPHEDIGNLLWVAGDQVRQAFHAGDQRIGLSSGFGVWGEEGFAFPLRLQGFGFQRLPSFALFAAFDGSLPIAAGPGNVGGEPGIAANGRKTGNSRVVRTSVSIDSQLLSEDSMRRTIVPVAITLIALLCSTSLALYSLSEHGDWPATWPKELDALRKQATTLVGPMVPQQHFLIPFTDQKSFEAAWPYLLKVKSQGAPIILVRGPKTDFFKVIPAGVVIHAPPKDIDRKVTPEAPMPDSYGQHIREKWMWTTYIELAVDGKIVDLNRIPLPADTPIIDERFTEKR